VPAGTQVCPLVHKTGERKLSLLQSCAVPAGLVQLAMKGSCDVVVLALFMVHVTVPPVEIVAELGEKPGRVSPPGLLMSTVAPVCASDGTAVPSSKENARTLASSRTFDNVGKRTLPQAAKCLSDKRR